MLLLVISPTKLDCGQVHPDFCYVNEIDGERNDYCDERNTQYPCVPEKCYYGRGPIQLATIMELQLWTSRGEQWFQARVNYYTHYCSLLGVDPSDNLTCISYSYE
ncbi:hypothetical protein VNO77_01006 [Canavalia gladiata]|uniref:Glycoside hydrolase family 19 catalytic domain-containing protein n=1 Tax=Canavalia gladiata TaxID=3824 RepID=A0AAN9R1U7_CANGL